jgi:hypothetical protein
LIFRKEKNYMGKSQKGAIASGQSFLSNSIGRIQPIDLDQASHPKAG